MSSHTLEIPGYGIQFEADRIRRERQELIGELTVRCHLPGAKSVNGVLSTADFNFSSLRARQDRAKHLEQRAVTGKDVDWYGLLEEFCQGVFQREREGDPACDIWEVPLPPKADDFAIEGLAFPRRHPSILFGDGGSAKSYMALYLAGKLSLQGIPVALFDWELSGEEHRERFQRLFALQRPKLTYCRCESPLASEIDRLARIVKEKQIAYAFFDSISFACDGRPEEAESASRYFRALRSLNIGSLHVAHVNKSEDSEKKPFGSSFWHNGARCTWFVKAEDGRSTLDLGFYHRKSNLGPLRPAVSFSMIFGPDFTRIARSNIADTPELAERMKTWQRIEMLLQERQEPMSAADIADELNEKIDTIRKAAARKANFRLIKGYGSVPDRFTLAANL